MYRHFAQQIEARAGFHVGGPIATTALSTIALASGASGGRVLDLCSGIGPSVSVLRRTIGDVVVRLDLVIEQLLRGQRTARVAADAVFLPFRDSSFDIVWSEDAFSHVPDRHALLRECYRILAPGGHLVFSDLVRFRLHAGAADAFCDAWSLAPLETSDSYNAILKDVGFISRSIVPVGRQMVSAHLTLESKIGDATPLEYERWLDCERRALAKLWGEIGLRYQRIRLKMYSYLQNGDLDHLYVAAIRPL